MSLVVTLAVELPIVFYLIKYFYENKSIEKIKICVVTLIASTLTLPYLWFVLPFFISNPALHIVIGELLVVCTEAVIFRFFFKLNLSKSLSISLIANLSSIVVGLIIF